MSTKDGRYTIVFNGEIYNFKSLRSELSARGVSFSSSGDTEVLLNGLEQEGAAFVGRLNGMFAFALWDDKLRELLLARDPLGIKPLYVTSPSPETLLFSSEIKALYAYPDLDRDVDCEALLHHLSFGHSCGDRTALRSVKRLPPGCLLRWRSSRPNPKLERYWKPSFHWEKGFSRREGVLELRRKLKDSCRRQMVSDVPVGAFFSGGLDSTLLAAFAPEAGREKEFTGFTVRYPPGDNILDRAHEDAPFARRASKSLGIRHMEREVTPDVAKLWPDLIWHLDEPLADPAAIACFLISRLARDEGVPVLLSGQGADELFAGYPRYSAMAASYKLDKLPRVARKAGVRLSQYLPGAREGRIGATLRRIRRGLESIDLDPDRRFLSYCAGTSQKEVLAILDSDVRSEIGARVPADACQTRMEEEGNDGASRWLERDLSVYLPNHNLLYTDKMGMAVGLEARVPLIDIELVELVTRFPESWKFNGSVTKVILREAARGAIPDEVVSRPKAGFGAPYRKWLRHDLGEMWEDLTAESSVRRRGWFDPKALRRARELSQTGRQDLYMLQWAVLTIELWAQQFIDRNPAEKVKSATSNAKPPNGEAGSFPAS